MCILSTDYLTDHSVQDNYYVHILIIFSVFWLKPFKKSYILDFTQVNRVVGQNWKKKLKLKKKKKLYEKLWTTKL